jgi:translation initiation factor IF-1
LISIEVKSGNLHKLLNAENRMPTVCNAMRKLMQDGDEIIAEPPRRDGNNVRIKYYLPRI